MILSVVVKRADEHLVGPLSAPAAVDTKYVPVKLAGERRLPAEYGAAFSIPRPSLGFPSTESLLEFLHEVPGPAPLVCKNGDKAAAAAAADVISLPSLRIVRSMKREPPQECIEDSNASFARTHQYESHFRLPMKAVAVMDEVPISPYLDRLPRMPPLWYPQPLDVGWALHGDSPMEKYFPWQAQGGEVFLWLERFGLGLYAPLFLANGFDTLALVAQLESCDFSIMKMNPFHIRAMNRAVQDLRQVRWGFSFLFSCLSPF